MAGLRARHKAQREQKIIDAAEHMFRERGFTQTKIEDIALAADVSVGTIYNYFRNKTDLLMALVSMNDANIEDEVNRLKTLPIYDVADCVCGVFSITTLQSLEGLGRENWRHLIATSIVEKESPLGQNYLELTQRLQERVTSLLRALQSQGRIVQDCDVEYVGALLFRMEASLYQDLIASDSMSFEEYKFQLTEYARYILKNLAR